MGHSKTPASIKLSKFDSNVSLIYLQLVKVNKQWLINSSEGRGCEAAGRAGVISAVIVTREVPPNNEIIKKSVGRFIVKLGETLLITEFNIDTGGYTLRCKITLEYCSQLSCFVLYFVLNFPVQRLHTFA